MPIFLLEAIADRSRLDTYDITCLIKESSEYRFNIAPQFFLDT